MPSDYRSLLPNTAGQESIFFNLKTKRYWIRSADGGVIGYVISASNKLVAAVVGVLWNSVVCNSVIEQQPAIIQPASQPASHQRLIIRSRKINIETNPTKESNLERRACFPDSFRMQPPTTLTYEWFKFKFDLIYSGLFCCVVFFWGQMRNRKLQLLCLVLRMLFWKKLVPKRSKSI